MGGTEDRRREPLEPDLPAARHHNHAGSGTRRVLSERDVGAQGPEARPVSVSELLSRPVTSASVW